MVRTKKKKITRKRIMMGGSGKRRMWRSSTNPNWRVTSLQPPIFKLTLLKDKCDIPKDKKPFECYGKEVYECNNQAIGIVYNREKYEFYTITPLILSVSTMQLAANTGSISIIEENGNYYIGFINDFPSLRIEEDFNYAYKTRPLENLDNKKTKISNKSNQNSRKSSSQSSSQSSTQSIHDTQQEAQWFNVYEDEDTLNDLNFQLIENYHACENNVKKYNSAIHPNLDSIIRAKYYKKDKNGHTIEPIEPIEPIYISSCTNLETYEYLTQKVRELIDIIKNKTESQSEEPQQQHSEPSNLTLKLKDLEIILHKFLSNELSIAELNKLSIEQLLLIRKIAISKVIYRANIKFEDGTKEYITENIRWVCSNALWVETYLELKLKYNTQKNQKIDLLTDVNFSILQDPIYKCDLSGLQHDFFIVDEFVNSSEGDGQNYVIVGYPDKNMREHILNFWQLKTDNSNQELYDSFNGLYKDLSKEIADLYDSYKKDEKDKINYTKDNPNNLYKLYSRFINNINYISQRYNELYKNENKNENKNTQNKNYDNFKIFEKEFLNNYISYYQQIADKYIKKPMAFIKYNFLVFKKTPDKKLLPMVFNIKELKKYHKPVLQHIDSLIKKELSHIFGILNENEYNEENSPFGNEYKLWYSGFTNGNFFHITTEYIHTMSNISRKAYHYLNFKTLEEIIYSCDLNHNNKSFLQDVKINYQVREYKINNYTILYQGKPKRNETEKEKPIRSEIVFKLYEEDKILKQSQKTLTIKIQNKVLLEQKNIPNMKFIFMFKSNNQEYTFIYLLFSNYYKLVIKSNMLSIIKEIIDELKKLYQKNNLTKNTITFANPNNLFKIISNEKLEDNIFTTKLKYNPVIYYKNNTSFNNGIDIINSNDFFTNEMLKENLKPLNKLNLFNQIPILVQHFLSTKSSYFNSLKSEYNKNSNTKDIECNDKIVKYNDEFPPCNKTLSCNPPVLINCIHINKFGYNFIEIIDNSANKIVVYVLPYNMNMENYLNYRDSSDSKVQYPYLGNNRDLDERSIPMLIELQKIYVNNKKFLCFLHQTSSPEFMCLHFHIIPEDEYKRSFPKEEAGTYMSQSININTLLNNIKINSNYYKNSNFSLIRQQ